MNNPLAFIIYLAVCAGVTYLVRALPLLFFRKKIENKFILSFLYYVPYAVLTAMTVPAILFSTGSVVSAAIGAAVAIVLAFFGKSLLLVAASSAAAVLIAEIVAALISGGAI